MSDRSSVISDRSHGRMVTLPKPKPRGGYLRTECLMPWVLLIKGLLTLIKGLLLISIAFLA